MKYHLSGKQLDKLRDKVVLENQLRKLRKEPEKALQALNNIEKEVFRISGHNNPENIKKCFAMVREFIKSQI